MEKKTYNLKQGDIVIGRILLPWYPAQNDPVLSASSLNGASWVISGE
jgi:hypothetical protein